MQYVNNFILFIIYLNILFVLAVIARILIGQVAALVRYSNIKQYKITNWYITIFCIYFYIFVFLLGLYCLRLYNLKKVLDLKIIYYNVYNIISSVCNISYIYTSLISFIVIFVIINLILSILMIYKSLNNQIYNLYLVMKYNPVERKKNYILGNKLNEPNDYDIISFYFIIFSHYLNKRLAYYRNDLIWEKKPDVLSAEYDKKWHIFAKYCEGRPWYHFDIIISKIMDNKFYYKIFIPFSPIIIILYDCIFNDWVITHVYYYLLLYIPLMLWRRFTILLSTENGLIGELIWDILYKKEHCIYALPKDHRKLFDTYIANGIRTIDLGPPALMDFDVSSYIKECSKFEYNQVEKSYQNFDLLEIREPLLYNKDKTLTVIRWENGIEITEYWEPIVIKYNYIITDNCEIIVNFNKK